MLYATWPSSLMPRLQPLDIVGDRPIQLPLRLPPGAAKSSRVEVGDRCTAAAGDQPRLKRGGDPRNGRGDLTVGGRSPTPDVVHPMLEPPGRRQQGERRTAVRRVQQVRPVAG